MDDHGRRTAGTAAARPTSRKYVAATLALTMPLVALLFLLLPTSTIGLDSEIYLRLAQRPFGSDSSYLTSGPFPFRLLVPFLVWLSPLPIELSFHAITLTGLVAGALAVALLARAVGVGVLGALAGPVYVAAFVGFYGIWQWRMVDTVTAALCTGAILAAYERRRWLFAVLAALATASKEVGWTLPGAWLMARWGEGRGTRAILLETVLVAAPAFAMFVLMHLFIPHYGSYGLGYAIDQWMDGFTRQAEWGYAKVLGQVMLQNYGMLWLLWPLGIVLGPPHWRRLHVYALLLVPVLAGGPWARSALYLYPFVLVSALVVLERQRPLRSMVALAGSAWVAILLSLRNIAVEPPSLLGSNLGLLPGAIVFVVAAYPAFRASIEEVAPRRSRLVTGAARRD